MIVTDDLLPIAKTSDDQYVYYKVDGEYDGVFILKDKQIKVTLADFFAKRNDITAIEDGDKEKKIWRRLRKEMGVNELAPEYPEEKALRPEKFDPDAEDGDGDGLVQEGTTFQRPAAPKLVETRQRLSRRLSGMGKSPTTSTDPKNPEFRQQVQKATGLAQARAKGLNKPARKMFSGRQRPASTRRKILDGSSFASFSGVRRLFKNRDDAYSDLKASTIKTLGQMREAAISGKLNLHGGDRELDAKVVKYITSRTPEQMWDDLEKSALKLHDAVQKMPVQSRTKADLAEMIVNQGLLGDPSNRVRRPDMKTPYVISRLMEKGHVLSDEDIRVLEANGLLDPNSTGGRGAVYETLREILEQAMGFSGSKDREGRPVYGYFEVPTPMSTQERADLTDIGRRLHDGSNGPNLPGYSDSSLVRLRSSVKDRTGYSYGDSLRNGILPRRVGDGEDKDTVLAVIHDKDFTDFADPVLRQEFDEIQQRYILGLMRWNLSGDISHLTAHDYIEAVIPHDVAPEEIEEMVVATDKLSVFRQDLEEMLPIILAKARDLDVSGNKYGDLLMFLQGQSTEWGAITRSGGEMAGFANLDSSLKEIMQLFKGSQIKAKGEEKGIAMSVGPSRTGMTASLDDAIVNLLKRFT